MITGTTRFAAVLGFPVEHSRSPAMHNAGFAALAIDAVMIPMAVAPADLAIVVRGLAAADCLGASVTTPHKHAVVALCDELSVAAQKIGAVNCLQFIAGRIIGHNTDGDGFADALRAAKIRLRGQRTLLLGGGGAACAVAYGVRDAGAVEVIARRPEAVRWATAWPWTPAQLRETFARADIMVDCTSTALRGGPDEAALVDGLPWDALRPTAVVVSLTYHRDPLLLVRARALGLTTVNGRDMLLHQGLRAFELWTGEAAPIAAMSAAL